MSFTTKEVDVTTGVETLARDALPESGNNSDFWQNIRF